ncbi:uncharacterized protein F4812DRAFT_465730 [Daldinia caldariorum]|uniref:uncharacterized protein n=1 Tax=Daldinia caldariorum TaxID=326644 RepID=UPI002008B80B|nr:uncharacterized protein F4812DRAFT_465730 [Daldinia caldariorum]KAI1466479.1 hypothetical protein F4812DRAFT_465730 [Daldinia caldariorum]
MATPSRLEEGYEMRSIRQETRSGQQFPSTTNPPEITPGDNGAGQDTIPANFRSDFELKNEAPKGWPSIAAAQLHYPNYNIYRRFSYLLHRALIDQETKLAYLENKLRELDKEDERCNSPRLTSLPFDPETLLSSYTRSQRASIRPIPTTSRVDDAQQTTGYRYNEWKDKDRILEAFIPRLKNYYELLQFDKEMQKLPTISHREHTAFYEHVKDYHTLDEAAYKFLFSNEDFTTTTTDRVHQYFEALIYGKPPVRWFFRKIFGRTHRNNNRDTPPEVEISHSALKMFVKVSVVFGSGVLLLSPVAILFLVNLPRGLSFAVVVVFIFAFVVVLASFNSNWDTILVGLSAYMAVLATFLSNLEQGKTQIS